MTSVLEIIKQAAREKKILKIIYIEKDGTSEGWRYIEPYSFTDGQSGQALFAWDLDKNGIRRFIINNIQESEIVDREYQPRYTIEIR